MNSKVKFMKNILLPLALLCILRSQVIAQPTTEQRNSPIGFLSRTTIIPPAPEAASLGQYGNVPVSLYNGRTNLSIPLYELKGKELSLPISLSYNSGGFKVAEDPGWVGMGWSLNAGGVITRSANGRPDKCYNYYDKSAELSAGTLNLDERGRQDFYEQITKGYIEGQPDSYFFNFANLNGKFHINPNRQIILTDYKPITIQFGNFCENESTATVTGPDGVRYIFNDREVTTLQYDDADATSIIRFYTYTSSWYLTQMISANAIDTFKFEYQYIPSLPATILPLPESMSYTTHGPTLADGTGSTPPCGEVSGPTQTEITTVSIARIFLNKIKYRNTEIIFTATGNSSDFGGKKLDAIQVLNNGLQTKKIVFTNSYFDTPNEPNDWRLRLDKITEFGPLAQISPPYEFTYSNLNLPSIRSKAIDHWGYYNGAGNGWLIPNILDGSCLRGTGANRNTDPETVKACSLVKVKYPTGGSTEFTYGVHVKNNEYSKTSKQMVEVGHSQTAMVLGGIYQTGQTCAGSPRFQVTDFIIPETASRVEANMPGYVWNEQQHGEGAKVFAGIIKAENFTFSDCNLYEFVTNNRELFDHYWFLEEDLYPPSIFGGLIPGDYKMVVLSEFSSMSPLIEVIYYTQELMDVTTIVPQQFIGGLRIEKITDFSKTGTIASTKTYEYGDAKSFGEPNYFNLSGYFYEAPIAQMQGGLLMDYSSWTMTISSSSGAALGSVMGSHVGYGHVIERTVDSNNISEGYKKFIYRNNDIENAGNGFGLDLMDYGQGDLLGEEVYDETGTLLTETTNEYAYDLGETRNSLSIAGTLVYGDPQQSNRLTLAEQLDLNDAPTGYYTWFYAFNENKSSVSSSGNDHLSPTNRHTYKVKNRGTGYLIHGNWQYLAKTTKTEFKNGLELNTYVKNYYDDPLLALPTKIENKTSKGEVQWSDLLYTYRSQLFQKTDYIGVNLISASQRISYEYQGQKAFPKDVYFTKSEIPFTPSQLESKFEKRATYQYNFSTGDLVEYKKIDDTQQSFLWSNDHLQLIAEANGASASEIAFTSFENGAAEGNWQFGNSISTDFKTGIRSHSLNGNPIVRNNLLATNKYVVTYWAKNGTPTINNVTSSDDDLLPDANGWKFFKKVVTNTTSITISGGTNVLIDEVRLAPLNAQITSYCYHPADVGVTSISDPNGIISYYKYNDAGKLELIQDSKGRILKSFIYHYQSGQ
jgi:hypothetical protein